MNKFKGWKNVFSFNYKQSAGSKSYIAVTVIVAIIIVAAAVLISILAAKPKEEDKSQEASYCTVETAYVLDLAGLGEMMDPPIGKSGVNARLRKISEIANKLRSGENLEL